MDETGVTAMDSSFSPHEHLSLSPIITDSRLKTSFPCRKLFSTSTEDIGNCSIRSRENTLPPSSPPYKRVHELRICEDPLTPTSLMYQQTTSTPCKKRLRRSRLLPKLSGSYYNYMDSAVGASLSYEEDLKFQIYGNPFTPICLGRKKSLSVSDVNENITPLVPSLKMRETNTRRLSVEFVHINDIGCGSFGSVSKCLNKLDGCVYAIKRSLMPVAGSSAEKVALNEVYAHAALGRHKHIVRYYSAWAEDDHMIIQSEYCNGGTLQDLLATSAPLPEKELLTILSHISAALAYMHSFKLVHMDVKPENIFLCERHLDPAHSDDEDDHENYDHISSYTYKLGDLGHVIQTTAESVEEGDCRYLPKEVLNDDYSQLVKADIFALGLTIYEAGGGGPLPKNGPRWHELRNGKSLSLPNVSSQFNALLLQMVSQDPSARPSASSLKRHQLLTGGCDLSREQLRRQLAAVQQKNEILTKQLERASECLKHASVCQHSDARSIREDKGISKLPIAISRFKRSQDSGSYSLQSNDTFDSNSSFKSTKYESPNFSNATSKPKRSSALLYTALQQDDGFGSTTPLKQNDSDNLPLATLRPKRNNKSSKSIDIFVSPRMRHETKPLTLNDIFEKDSPSKRSMRPEDQKIKKFRSQRLTNKIKRCSMMQPKFKF